LGLKNTYRERVETGAVAGSGFVHGYTEETEEDKSLVSLVTNYLLLKCTFFLIKMWRRQLWGIEVMLT
jgi:hypothetical protein